ncbi:LA_3334 family protein [Leptospira licerasiae]|uniref:LA_3334 family protein n=1 Tax=Leptospira licerasiae TaxID=447106 RepID=UPI00301948EA
MKLKLKITWLLVTILTSSGIQATELLLNNGDAFILEVISEDEKYVRVQWKNRVYAIPKKDIRKLDYSKKGEQSSYSYSTYQLKDGSRIQGILAKENDSVYVIRTEVGFLEIDKSRVSNVESSGIKEPDLPSEYLPANQPQPETVFGLTAAYMPNFQPLGPAFPATGAFGFFVEPAFMRMKDTYQWGFRIEGLASKSESGNFSVLHAWTNFGRNWLIGGNQNLDFYAKLGLGVASVQYKHDDTSRAGIDPSASVELGYQGFRWGDFQLRAGIRGTCFFETAASFCMAGLEISIGKRL